jgi:uncharacterized membrane protein YcaP (DUF421 family)
MSSNEIKLSDWTRFFHGEAPAEFYIEIVIRVFFVYLLLMISMRLMGKRMSSQLSRNELAALVALAAAIGVPMLDPTRGLLPAVIISAVIVLAQRMTALWAYRDQGFEKISQGDLSVLVNNSVMDVRQMQEARITRERLFGQLRSEGLYHLGQVKRMYFEANGNFTIIKNTEPAPGLLVLPYSDEEFIREKELRYYQAWR